MMHASNNSPLLRGSTHKSGNMNARKPRRTSYLVGFLVLVGFLIATGKAVRRISSRQHVYDVVIKTSTEPYMIPKDPQKVFKWSSDTFLPPTESSYSYINGKMAELRGQSRDPTPATVHAIEINPRKADLSGLPDHVNPEEIVFGFTSPYLRVRDMCKTWRHFLNHGSQCVIAFAKEQDTFVKDLKYYLEKEELSHCQVIAVDLGKYTRYEHRVLNMPRLMNGLSYTDRSGRAVKPKWFVVADDDTQVLDVSVFQRLLSERRHDEDHLLCALTESSAQIGRHGRICYGGGGIVISAAFAKKMADHTDECFWWHHWKFGGDEMLTHCASTSTANATGSIPPDKVFEAIDGLHQIDIPGDGTGIFQSGLPFITIHHYTGWLDLFPPWSTQDNKMVGLARMQNVSDFLGGDNMFKRYVFDDGYTLLTLGYSITLFSKPLKTYEMQLLEKTHRFWEHELRWPSRPGIPEGKTKGRYKITYYVKDILPAENTLIYQSQRGDVIRAVFQFQ